MEVQVIVHRFSPFANAKVLMEVTAKYCAHADAIICDFGDPKFVKLQINTLAKIFGENAVDPCNGEHDCGENIKFQACDTIYDEVETTFNQIRHPLSRDTLVKVGTCFKGPKTVQLPILVANWKQPVYPIATPSGILTSQ
jgi:hypothetical protein